MVALSATAAAQPVQWQALTGFHAGSCRNAIDDGSGFLFLSLPVTNGYDFRGILRYEIATGVVADVRPPGTAPIRSFDTTASGLMFCATETGLLYSDNSGQNWFPDTQLGSDPAFMVHTIRGTTYAVGDSGFVYQYDDTLGQWDRLGQLYMDHLISTRSKAFYDLTADNSGILFLAQCRGPINARHVQMSADGGRTWEYLNSTGYFISSHASSLTEGLLLGEGTRLWRALPGGKTLDSIPGVYGAVTSIVEEERGTLFLALGEWAFPWQLDAKGPNGVMKSEDGGDSWTWLREGIPIQHLAFMKDGRLLCSTPTQGFLLMDPVTGDTSHMPLSYGNVTDIVVSAEGVVNAAVDSSIYLECYRCSDNGATWQPGRSGILAIEVVRPRLIFDAQDRLTLGGGTWVRSTDGGDSFKRLNINWRGFIATVTHTGEWITEGSYSNDDGENWSSMKIPYIAGAGWTHGPFDIEEVHPGHLLASGSIGLAYRQGPQGSPWSRVGLWKPTDIARAADGTVYTGTRDTTSSFIRSTDHGATWRAFAIRDSLAIHDALHAGGGVLAATARQFTRYGEVEPGTGCGLYFSTDLVNWADASSGLPTRDIACLVRDSAGYLYAGTRGFGIYRSTLPFSKEGPAVLSAGIPLPADPGIELHVYPQPTTGSATVLCRLSTAGPLTLGLFDLLGRRLAVLSGGQRYPAGIQHFPIDLARYPAGTYFLQAFSGSLRAQSRLLLRTL